MSLDILFIICQINIHYDESVASCQLIQNIDADTACDGTKTSGSKYFSYTNTWTWPVLTLWWYEVSGYRHFKESASTISCWDSRQNQGFWSHRDVTRIHEALSLECIHESGDVTKSYHFVMDLNNKFVSSHFHNSITMRAGIYRNC